MRDKDIGGIPEYNPRSAIPLFIHGERYIPKNGYFEGPRLPAGDFGFVQAFGNRNLNFGKEQTGIVVSDGILIIDKAKAIQRNNRNLFALSIALWPRSNNRQFCIMNVRFGEGSITCSTELASQREKEGEVWASGSIWYSDVSKTGDLFFVNPKNPKQLGSLYFSLREMINT